jgi:hypothetical protein
MLLVPAEITNVSVTTGDITAVTINAASSNLVVASDITAVSIQTSDTTVMSAAPATINLASLSFATSAPADVARTASVGVSNLAARADHVHSAADLLMDGGNY